MYYTLNDFESKHILYDRCFIALSITTIETLDVINQRTSPLDWRWHLLFINFNPKIHHQQYTYCSQRCFYFWYVLHLYLLIHCIPATLSFRIYPIIEKHMKMLHWLYTFYNYQNTFTWIWISVKLPQLKFIYVMMHYHPPCLWFGKCIL